MLWLWACGVSENSSSKMSDEEFYDESNWENGQEEPTTEEDVGDIIEFAWWNVVSELHLEDGVLNKEKSTVEIVVFSAEYAPVCSVVFQFEEALETEPSFEEGYLWWRILLREAPEDMQDNICTYTEELPTVLHLGVGSLHIESLAIWNDVSWGEVAPPEREDAMSSYISLDNGDSVWVYGVAKSVNTIDTDGVNIMYLRPAFFFPFGHNLSE